MVKPTNLASIEKATHKSWSEWLAFFGDINAESLDHTHIAAHVFTELDGKIASPGWWAQAVTVAYEQHIGRRQPGQRSDGRYECSVSRVFDGGREDVFAMLLERTSSVTQLNERRIENDRTSVTPVRSYWRADLDETKVTLAVEEKTPEKSLVVVTHSELSNDEQVSTWRTFWKEWLNSCITEE